MHLLLLLATSLFFSTMSHLSAIEHHTEINLSGGYRNDQLASKIDLTTTPPQVPTVNSALKSKIDDISIGQIGFDGRIMFPYSSDPCCEFYFLNNFYLDGFAYWGWSGEGNKLHLTDEEDERTTSTHIKLKEIQTDDYQVGLGYLFDDDCWAFGVSAGYAYNSQKIKSKGGEISTPSNIDLLTDPLFSDGYKTKTHWQGPWVGVELYYDWCHWAFTLGYEYHFATYHQTHKNPSSMPNIASKIKANDAYGNVVYLDAIYRFCGGWQAGFEFKYQDWQARHGHVTTHHANITLPPDETLKAKANAQWQSYSIMADIGYAF